MSVASGELEELGRIFESQDVVADRAEARGRYVIESGRHRALLELVRRPVDDLNAARALGEDVRASAYRQALAPLLQVGLNRWLEANCIVAEFFDGKDCAPLAGAVRAIGGVSVHQHRGAELVLDQLAHVVGVVLAHRPITNEEARWFLSGDQGRNLAMQAVLRQLEELNSSAFL